MTDSERMACALLRFAPTVAECSDWEDGSGYDVSDDIARGVRAALRVAKTSGAVRRCLRSIYWRSSVDCPAEYKEKP